MPETIPRLTFKHPPRDHDGANAGPFLWQSGDPAHQHCILSSGAACHLGQAAGAADRINKNFPLPLRGIPRGRSLMLAPKFQALIL
jgi:hypothetical protein